MAENMSDSLEILNGSVEQLMELCDRLKYERDEALNRLASMKADLVNADLEIKALRQKNKTLQNIQLGDVSLTTARQNRAQLSKLVREIDKCIALLNA